MSMMKPAASHICLQRLCQEGFVPRIEPRSTCKTKSEGDILTCSSADASRRHETLALCLAPRQNRQDSRRKEGGREREVRFSFILVEGLTGLLPHALFAKAGRRTAGQSENIVRPCLAKLQSHLTIARCCKMLQSAQSLTPAVQSSSTWLHPSEPKIKQWV